MSTDRLAARGSAKRMTMERGIDIPLNKIRFDTTQPRKAFHHLDGRIAEKDEAYIEELAQSIQKNSLIQAITVQEVGDGTYSVVVGECRTRAHLKLGLPTIRAVVRNDLDSRAKKLLFQLAENVNRENLSDEELAQSIRDLMQGSDGVEAMTQVQIAETLGKSKGWVSRFVKFGDEELQRLWVQSGIVDTVEKLYRLSILPIATQMDICRRVALPVGDVDRIEKPLNRNVIDELARQAKIGKNGAHYQAPMGTPLLDPAAAAVDGGAERQDISNETPQVDMSTGQYQLPEGARAALVGASAAANSIDSSGAREPIQPPVTFRGTVSDVCTLLDVLKSNPQACGAINDVPCDLKIPTPLAQLIANALTGVIVDAREVPAILQIELAKLH